MDFNALTKQEGMDSDKKFKLTLLLCLEVSPLKALLKRIRCKLKKNKYVPSFCQHPNNLWALLVLSEL